MVANEKGYPMKAVAIRMPANGVVLAPRADNAYILRVYAVKVKAGKLSDFDPIRR
jgi:hypothetical protein